MSAKILIVEDDKYLIKVYETKLAAKGYHVQVATDGDMALQALDTFKPDLIVLDLVMPRKDGFAFLRERVNYPGGVNVPVIVATNLGQKDDAEQVKSLGADDFVFKSNTSIDALIGKIETMLARSKK